MSTRLFALTLIALIGVGFAQPATAQSMGLVQSDVLVLDTDRLFTGSLLGQKILSDYETERNRVIEANKKIDAELSAEEEALTETRPTMTPEEFRAAADAFDAKVQSIREENLNRARELEQSRDRAPLIFLRLVEPVLGKLMGDTGAEVIMNSRAVLLRADSIDVTDLAIQRVNEAFTEEMQRALENATGTAKPQLDQETPTETPSGTTPQE